MADHNDIGKWGENLVVDKLITEGYTVAERNWRSNHAEIDIIAIRGDEIIFVEVKTRSSDDYGNPLDAITPKKISNLARAVNAYLRQMKIDLRPRFDVASIIGDGHEVTSFEYIPNAFLPPLRTY